MGTRFVGVTIGLLVAGSLSFFSAVPALAEGFIDRIPVDRLLPPPPSTGSSTEKAELAEIRALQAAATPAAMAAAKHDNDVEDATIFAVVIGPAWDLTKLPKTKFLVDRILDVDRPDSSAAKKVYPRLRPWLADSKIQTCAPHEPGVRIEAYPSGHTMVAFEMAGVLASLMPNHAPAILKRAREYAENRIVCGFHHRSDIVAGESYGMVLAVEMMQHPVFKGWFNAARAELKAAGITR